MNESQDKIVVDVGREGEKDKEELIEKETVKGEETEDSSS